MTLRVQSYTYLVFPVWMEPNPKNLSTKTFTSCETSTFSTSCSIPNYNFLMDNPLKFTPTNVMKLRAISHKLNKICMLLIWSSNINGLLIPSSSPHRFHENFLHICKDIWKNIYFVFEKILNVCFHEVPHYYEKEVQFVILLKMWHLDNSMVFSFPKHVMLKR